MKERSSVCFHCGEYFDPDRPVCPHCGADRDYTYAEEPVETGRPDELDEAAYAEFLASEGLSGRPKGRFGCAATLFLSVSGLLWILLQSAAE